MRLQHLQLLLAIAETGSLHASARAMNVTQPALTKALRQLEEEFGMPLVLRLPRGVRLAPAGELLAARAATAMREIDRAREEVAWLSRHKEARVTIGVSPVAAALVAPAALARFGARWPQVRVRVVDSLYPQVMARVRGGEFDFAVGPLPSEGVGHDLLARPLAESRNVIVARRDHPLAGARRLEELAEAEWMLTGPAGGPGDPAHLPFAALGLPTPRVRFECESLSTLLAMIASLDILAILPGAFFERDGPRFGLAEVAVAAPVATHTIHALQRSDAPLTLPAQRLLDAFVHEARALQAAPATPATSPARPGRARR